MTTVQDVRCSNRYCLVMLSYRMYDLRVAISRVSRNEDRHCNRSAHARGWPLVYGMRVLNYGNRRLSGPYSKR
ncbi:hypothetical protein DAEQUDRAFT_166327 [Daedalea quercina L-15889]|uniref:Uncharacterized protein n=1 Tax=Daedalea quercina L-15889 TaxID=1314783 RepID=A0A165RI71_9APHY|nr:hypothetical protein DAEQUDRAFT_166327 [Daedalea quercina L-15889]